VEGDIELVLKKFKIKKYKILIDPTSYKVVIEILKPKFYKIFYKKRLKECRNFVYNYGVIHMAYIFKIKNKLED
jgi:hypothetical protein